MYSFGDLKNNLQRLIQLNKTMNILDKIKWNKTVLTQKEIKTQPIEFYLRIMHFVMTQYSPQLYRAILDIVPNLKTLSDQKFVESAFIISRKLLSLNPTITAQQFLQPNKLIEKRLELIVDLCSNIQVWQEAQDKKNKKQPKLIEKQVNYPSQELQSDEDDILQRELNVRPTFIDERTFNVTNGAHQIPSKKFDSKKTNELQGKSTVMFPKSKPNVFPKATLNNFAEDEEQDNQFYNFPAKKAAPIPAAALREQEGGGQVVSRQQFDEMVGMIATLSTTMNNLVLKFNDFQYHVTNQLNKINARTSLLQENVKIIKQNI